MKTQSVQIFSTRKTALLSCSMVQWILTSISFILRSVGVGREVKHARVLTKDDEEKLWQSGVMDTKTPKALQNAAFFIVRKMFSLRGGVELRNVKTSQIKKESNPDRYVYTENVAKNGNGTFK